MNLQSFYKGKRVLITGHTGFKGSWLAIWLHEMGAEVVGLALEPHSERDNYVLSGIGQKIKADLRVDIRDAEKVKDAFAAFRPEIVFHSGCAAFGASFIFHPRGNLSNQCDGYDKHFGGGTRYSKCKGGGDDYNRQML